MVQRKEFANCKKRPVSYCPAAYFPVPTALFHQNAVFLRSVKKQKSGDNEKSMDFRQLPFALRCVCAALYLSV